MGVITAEPHYHAQVWEYPSWTSLPCPSMEVPTLGNLPTMLKYGSTHPGESPYYAQVWEYPPWGTSLPRPSMGVLTRGIPIMHQS